VPPEFAPWFLPLAAFLLGINVGSFLNVCIYRMPRNCVTVSHPSRSFCPICRRHLRWYENQPLIGWLLLRGRCAGCKLKISPRYPIFEGLTGILWALAALRYLPMGQIEVGAFFVTVIFFSVVIVAAMIDYDLRILPDRLTIPGMVLGPIAVWCFPVLCPGIDIPLYAREIKAAIGGPVSWWDSSLLSSLYLGSLDQLIAIEGRSWQPSLQALGASVAGLCFGAAMIWAISSVGRRILGREVMGFGDVKYMGMLGALLGVKGSLLTVLLACMLGSLGGLIGKWMRGSRTIPSQSFSVDMGLVSRLFFTRFRKEELELPAGQKGYRFTGLVGFLARILTGDGTIPFGPYLSVGAILVILCPQTIEHCLLVWWPSLLAGGS
jgi:leader peptidase (prepilin peptidase) / N-methyltransferase